MGLERKASSLFILLEGNLDVDEDTAANSPRGSVWVVGDGPAVSQYSKIEN